MKVAVLDMYKGVPNLGMGAIRQILADFPSLDVEYFNVREKREIPGQQYDLYISSGGPGNPLEGDGIWNRGYFYLMEQLWQHNQRYDDKKYGFFICHSFQMICHFLSLGSIVKRNKQSLGVFPAHKTAEGKKDPLLQGLGNPFYVADSRKWQFIQPYDGRIERMGCKVLAVEKERPHVPLERAVMAMRFSDEWVGVQFHPEAGYKPMFDSLSSEKTRAKIFDERGEGRYKKIIEGLNRHGAELDMTYETILPGFIRRVKEMKQIERVSTSAK